jgi:hypothetical protein
MTGLRLRPAKKGVRQSPFKHILAYLHVGCLFSEVIQSPGKSGVVDLIKSEGLVWRPGTFDIEQKK